ncbi:MAG: sigma-54-dependent Fis family transcriptional regulator [Myxococcota bacterium]
MSFAGFDTIRLIMRRVLDDDETDHDEDWSAIRRSLREQQIDLDAVLARIVDAATRRLGADRGTLYLIDHARQEVVSRIAHLPEIREIRLKLGEGVAGQVAHSGETRCVPSEPLGASFNPLIDQQTGYHTRSLLAVAVRDEQRTILGVLQLLNKQTGLFDRADQKQLEQLGDRVGALLAESGLRSQLCGPARQPLSFRFNHIVGESAAMQRVYGRTARAARTDATVLITGESGTGKEAIARAVHFNSARRDRPFVVVDCAALPADLIENELFGHERGAYTSADRSASGRVAAAEGGTLFLDEIAELPLLTQSKILRLVQERTFTPLGANTPQAADVRFVCATHRDLSVRVSQQAFRHDLYYRLRVIQIELPPLRDRGGGDLDRLIDHFFYEFKRAHDRPELEMTVEARSAMHAHTWPGNVRELKHCVESAVVMAPGPRVTPELLPFLENAPIVASTSCFQAGVMPLRELERRYVAHVLEHFDGNRSAAARALQIGRNTLLRKLNED